MLERIVCVALSAALKMVVYALKMVVYALKKIANVVEDNVDSSNKHSKGTQIELEKSKTSQRSTASQTTSTTFESPYGQTGFGMKRRRIDNRMIHRIIDRMIERETVENVDRPAVRNKKKPEIRGRTDFELKTQKFYDGINERITDRMIERKALEPSTTIVDLPAVDSDKKFESRQDFKGSRRHFNWKSHRKTSTKAVHGPGVKNEEEVVKNNVNKTKMFKSGRENTKARLDLAAGTAYHKNPGKNPPKAADHHRHIPPTPPSPPPPPPQMELPKLPSPMKASPPEHKSALLDSTRNGIKLKHVELPNPDKKSSMSDARNDLLNEIRNGVKLKPIKPIDKKSANIIEKDGLAGVMARVLAKRAKAWQYSDSSSTSSGEDSEWDD